MIFLNYQQLNRLSAWQSKMKNITFVFFVSLMSCCVNLHAAQKAPSDVTKPSHPKVLICYQDRSPGFPSPFFEPAFPGIKFIEVEGLVENFVVSDEHKDAAAILYVLNHTARFEAVNFDSDEFTKLLLKINSQCKDVKFSIKNVFIAAMTPGSPNSATPAPPTATVNKQQFNVLTFYYANGTPDEVTNTNNQNLKEFGNNFLAPAVGRRYDEIATKSNPAGSSALGTTQPATAGTANPTQDSFSVFFVDTSEKVEFSTAIARLILIASHQIAKNNFGNDNKKSLVLGILADAIRIANDIAMFYNEKYKNRNNIINWPAIVCDALIIVSAITKAGKLLKKENPKKKKFEKLEFEDSELDELKPVNFESENSDFEEPEAKRPAEQKQASNLITSLDKYGPYFEGLLAFARSCLKLNKFGNHTNIANACTVLIMLAEIAEFYTEIQK